MLFFHNKIKQKKIQTQNVSIQSDHESAFGQIYKRFDKVHSKESSH